MIKVCPKCKKPFATLNTEVQGETRVRYLGCRKCKVRPVNNKVFIPLQYAPRRATCSSHE